MGNLAERAHSDPRDAAGQGSPEELRPPFGVRGRLCDTCLKVPGGVVVGLPLEKLDEFTS